MTFEGILFTYIRGNFIGQILSQNCCALTHRADVYHMWIKDNGS